MKNKKMIGNLMLILTAMIWGSAFVAQRVGMDDIGPLTFTAARMVFAFAATALASVLFSFRDRTKNNSCSSQEEVRERKRNTLLGGVCCGVFLAVATAFQQAGIVYTSAGKAGFITAMYMLLVPIINFVLFKKRNSWIVWLAVLTGVVGLYLLCMTERFSLARGDTLLCICALLFSGHILSCDRFVQRADPLKMCAIQFGTAALLSIAIALLTEGVDWKAISSALFPIFYCGVISGGIGFTLKITAQQYTDPTTASLLMSLESVFAVLSGALLLGERMTRRELLGCVVMFVAILLVQLPLEKGSMQMKRS